MDPKQGAGILIRTLEPWNNHDASSDEAATKPQRGDVVLVEYEGRLEDGTPFTTTQQRMRIVMGQDHVMEGWQVALPRLSLYQLVEVTIPHLYGYGELGYPPKVPPRATLVFTMRIIDIDDSNRTKLRGLWGFLQRIFFSQTS